jgi:hypothetical protein
MEVPLMVPLPEPLPALTSLIENDTLLPLTVPFVSFPLLYAPAIVFPCRTRFQLPDAAPAYVPQ